MNRSVERTRLRTSGIAPGELVVATGFAHPRRGWVRCHAAPLLAAGLSDVDRTTRRADVLIEPCSTEAVLFAVSWVDRDGCATGFGIATRLDDNVAQRAAEKVVGAWSAVLRTRRVLIAATDAAWPMFPTALARAREYVARGDTVALIGRSGDAIGNASGSTVLVETPGAVDALPAVDPERLSFVVVPGIPIEDATEIIAALRTRFPRLRGQHPDEFCYDASDRREALRSVAAASDLLVICEADAEQVAWAAPFPARELSDVGQIRPKWVNSASTVALAAGSSAPPGLLDEVVDVLRGLGPLSVARRRVTTDLDVRATQLWPAVAAQARSGEDGHEHPAWPVPAQPTGTADANNH